MPHSVAILGAGIGREHLVGYQALPAQFDLRWICDLDRDRAEAVATGTDARVTEDASEVLADPETDIVDICLPPRLHVPMALEALAAGKHVICEKPIAGGLADADRLTAAAQTAPGRIFPVFQYRFGPAFAALDALKAAGLTGDPLAGALETHWNRGADYYAVPWRGTWAYELGGAVLSHAIHVHDLAGRVLGPIAEVSACLATNANPIETEDCAAIAARTEQGALLTSSITLGAAENSTRLRFVFRDLTAESGNDPYMPARPAWRFIARDPARQGAVDEIVARTAAAPLGFAGFFHEIAEALAGRPSKAPNLADGIASIELATAIYAAARTGQRVSLPLPRDDTTLARISPNI